MADGPEFAHDREEYAQAAHRLQDDGWEFETDHSFSPAGDVPDVVLSVFVKQGRGPLGRFRPNTYREIVWLDR